MDFPQSKPPIFYYNFMHKNLACSSNDSYEDVLARPFRLAIPTYTCLSISDVLTLAQPGSTVDTPSSNARNIRNGKWDNQEDRRLTTLVEEIGERKWQNIATKMGNRSGKQCRERWMNHLRPNIKKSKFWSKEEEEMLIEAHKEIGNKWANIATRLPGRSECAIKNYWNATMRKLQSQSTNNLSTPLSQYISSRLPTSNA